MRALLMLVCIMFAVVTCNHPDEWKAHRDAHGYLPDEGRIIN